MAVNLPDRIQQKIMPEPNTGCWLWTAACSHNGYGIVWADAKLKYAHRVVYENERGPIPKGLDLDHKCRVRSCVNPEHLEPVTRHENLRRGGVIQKTQCRHGHSLSADNLYVDPRGFRECRVCRAAAMTRLHTRHEEYVP